MINKWKLFTLIIIFILIHPLLVGVLFSISEFNFSMLSHILDGLLFEYLSNTMVVLLFTLLFTSVIGYSLAYYMSFYKIKHKKILNILIILPLAIPTYIGAYTYGMMFSHTGVFSFLPFSIMNKVGLIFIYTIFLYPYIYIICRTYFMNFPKNIYDNALLLSGSSFERFKKIIFPMSKYTLISGMLLVSFEVLGEFGAANYFGVNVFSNAIYRSWIIAGDFSTALFLSINLLIIVSIFLYLYSKMKKRVDASQKSGGINCMTPSSRLKKIIYISILV